MKVTFLALALASVRVGYAQSPITISGQLVGCADSTAVEVFEPTPTGHVNYFFKYRPAYALVRNGRFSYQLLTTPTGLISLNSKCLTRLAAFVEPGATVTLISQPGPTGKPTTVFSGTNAAANNLLATNQLLNYGPQESQRFAKLLATAPTATAVMRTLEAELQKPLRLLDAAYDRHEISRACRDFLRVETEQRFLEWTGGPLVGHFTDSTRANLHLTMSRAETKRLAALLFTRYDPFLPRYQVQEQGNGNLKVGLIQKSILPGNAPTQRFWGQYQPQFEPIANGLERYDYLPAAMQQDEIGNLLLTALSLNAMSPTDFAAVFAGYVQRFPASPYNSLIVRSLRAESERARVAAATRPAAPTATTTAPQNQVFGFLPAQARTLTFGPAPGLDTVRTLGGLVRSQRPGRAVFVDLWASWCGPCVEEFKHEPALHKFLTDKNVDIIYIALDQPGFRDKWAALAASYQLHGYHYLAPPALQKALAPTVPYIPRYMLFDKNGKLVETSTYHPSDGEKLYQQVRERLR